MIRSHYIQLLVVMTGCLPGVAQSPALVKWSAPEYPTIARAARISGNFEATLNIDESGHVNSVEFQQSVPQGVKLLFKVTNEALLKWEFKPGTPGLFTVDIAFHLLPPAAPDDFIKSEFFRPNALIIRSKFVKPDPSVDFFNAN